ncbi:MAG: MBL fold metallo-hydrolase [Minisyncoccia bacterium]
MELNFYGAAQEITGSNFLLQSGDAKILIDCGLFQGSHYCEELNFKPFPYNPKEIQAVLITHAHLDHIGRLPKLYKDGFRGKIYSTPPTKDLAEFVLLDAAGLLKNEAEKFNQEILYDSNDILEVMKIWEKRKYHEKIQIGPFTAEFFDAGHILGSSFVVIEVEGKKIVFSGDLGNFPEPLIKKTETVDYADYVLIDSTYGDTIHENLSIRKDMLEDAIEETIKDGGVLMIPSFAMERTQELLFELNELIKNQRIPKIPIFIDSPLAIKLTSIYEKYSLNAEYFNQEEIKIQKTQDLFNFEGLKMTLTTNESKAINDVPAPKIIVAGSGMSNGGRILHHERRYLSDPRSMILFIGYQAKGTLGRQILDGVKNVKIFDENIEVKCKVKNISGYSAHADQNQLLQWLNPMRLSLQKIFAIHCEPERGEKFIQVIKDNLAINAIMPGLNDKFIL